MASTGQWTDIYSLAATLFFALTGRKPDPVAAARTRLADELKGRYADSFLHGIDEALEPNYRGRPQSVAEWRALLGLGSDQGTAVPPETWHEAPSHDEEATIVLSKSEGDPQQPEEPAADSPTVLLDAPPDPETGSESPAVPHHPIATGPREPRAKRAGWLRTHWLSALSLAVVAGILALLVWLWLGNGPPPPPPPGPALTPEQRIYAVLKGFDCIPWQVEKFAEDRYAIRGSVTSPDELQRLDAELGKIPATTHTGDVSIVPRPLCPLLGLADRYATEPRLAIRPNHPDGRYTTGDEFGVVFHNREHSSGRLYAFYINSAGKVYVPGPLLYVGTEARLEDYNLNPASEVLR